MNNKNRLGKGVMFERIRRITGYLVGTMDKWNNAKKAEERDRVKHGLSTDTNSHYVKHGLSMDTNS
jgi:ribonucleoside-triphosphate reductase